MNHLTWKTTVLHSETDLVLITMVLYEQFETSELFYLNIILN